jgi:BirA family biotin operon repressor/biotin-[acetyl-CoA-carboxylase] ligase
MSRAGLSAWSDYLAWCDRRRGREPRLIEVYRSTSSTQDATRRLLMSRGLAAHGCVTTADEQTLGRGRLGRRWVGPVGTALMASIGVVSENSTWSVDLLMLAACIATTRAIERLAPDIAVRIKWPNDLLVAERKIAGILVETFQLPDADGRQAAVVGIGINVGATPEDFAALDANLATQATSLINEGRTVDRLPLLNQLLAEFDAALTTPSRRELVDAWRDRSILLGEQVVLHHDRATFRGEVVDIDPEDGLVLRLSNGSFVHLPAATTTFHASGNPER